MANHPITLYVNVSNLTNQASVDACCNFGQTSNITNEDFNVSVNVGDTVTWNGVSTGTTSAVVNIESINHEGKNDQGSYNVFQSNIILGTGSPKTVVGTVQNNTGGEAETYKIWFTVVGKPGRFYIDPKISVLN